MLVVRMLGWECYCVCMTVNTILSNDETTWTSHFLKWKVKKTTCSVRFLNSLWVHVNTHTEEQSDCIPSLSFLSWFHLLPPLPHGKRFRFRCWTESCGIRYISFWHTRSGVGEGEGVAPERPIPYIMHIKTGHCLQARAPNRWHIP